MKKQSSVFVATPLRREYMSEHVLSRLEILLLSLGLVWVLPDRTALAASRPNILVVMTDDQRADTVQYMPNVQALLVQHGMTFQRAYASYPLCCPSRATFLTGQYAHNHGVSTIFHRWEAMGAWIMRTRCLFGSRRRAIPQPTSANT